MIRTRTPAELDAITALEAETQDHPREPRTAADYCERLTMPATCPNAATTTVTIDGNEYGACDVCAGRGKDEG